MKKLRSIIFVEVLKKMMQFKHSPNSRQNVLDYLLDEGRKSKAELKYNFSTENDTLNLKVLVNILYQEMDNLIQNCVLKDHKYGLYIKQLNKKLKGLEDSLRNQESSSRSGLDTVDREVNKSIGIKTVMNQKDFNMNMVLK